jgi:hypothetical protein
MTINGSVVVRSLGTLIGGRPPREPAATCQRGANIEGKAGSAILKRFSGAADSRFSTVAFTGSISPDKAASLPRPLVANTLA